MIFGRQDDNKRMAHDEPDTGTPAPVVGDNRQYADDTPQGGADNGHMLPSIDLDEASLENAATYMHQVTDPSMVAAPTPTTYQPTPPSPEPQAAYAPSPAPAPHPAPQPPKPRPAPKHTAPKPAPAPPKPQPKNTSSETADDLLTLKQQALNELTPLVGHLDQTPEERFRTTMMMIQSADNQSLIKDAYAAAQRIEDAKVRAQALLDVVNEINYFTQKKN